MVTKYNKYIIFVTSRIKIIKLMDHIHSEIINTYFVFYLNSLVIVHNNCQGAKDSNINFGYFFQN